jgi:hypothetical protein
VTAVATSGAAPQAGPRLAVVLLALTAVAALVVRLGGLGRGREIAVVAVRAGRAGAGRRGPNPGLTRASRGL